MVSNQDVGQGRKTRTVSVQHRTNGRVPPDETEFDSHDYDYDSNDNDDDIDDYSPPFSALENKKPKQDQRQTNW